MMKIALRLWEDGFGRGRRGRWILCMIQASKIAKGHGDCTQCCGWGCPDCDWTGEEQSLPWR